MLHPIGRVILGRSEPCFKAWVHMWRYASTSAPAAIGIGNTYNEILFGKSPKTFRELGILPELCGNLEAVGKGTATIIQAAAFQPIIEERTVVIGAETGCGKTLAYICPLLHILLRRQLNGSVSGIDNPYPVVSILVPNRDLGMQVEQMALEIMNGTSTFSLGSVTIGTVWSLDHKRLFTANNPSPTILISTPTFLSNYFKNYELVDEKLFRSIKHLVLDEADMLLEGDFLKHVESVLNAFKLLRRKKIHNGEIKVHEEGLQKILSAATIPTSGEKSVLKYLEQHFNNALRIENENLHKHHPLISQSFIEISDEKNAISSPKQYIREIIRCMNDYYRNLLNELDVPPNDENGSPAIICLKIQLDSAGHSFDERLVESILFQSANSAGSKDDAKKLPLTLIFANTVEHVMEISEDFKQHNIRHVQYHKKMTKLDRQEALRRFKGGEFPILVATDIASRGLDIPGIEHVIQAEFADNVVQYMHRIGRASRGGNFGQATNFYFGKHSSALVDTILKSVETETTVRNAFSRRRGLRRRQKREASREATASLSI